MVDRIYSGTVLGEEFFAISPVVVGINSLAGWTWSETSVLGVEEGGDPWKVLF